MADTPEVKNAESSTSEEVEDAAAKDQEPVKLTYKEIAKKNGINYTVTEVPPLFTSMLLGLQHYLTMLGATVLIPLIICPAMGADGLQTAEVISSIFFVSGINTVSSRPRRPFMVTKVPFNVVPHTFDVPFPATSNHYRRSVSPLFRLSPPSTRGSTWCMRNVVIVAHRISLAYLQVAYHSRGLFLIPPSDLPNHFQCRAPSY